MDFKKYNKEFLALKEKFSLEGEATDESVERFIAAWRLLWEIVGRDNELINNMAKSLKPEQRGEIRKLLVERKELFEELFHHKTFFKE